MNEPTAIPAIAPGDKPPLLEVLKEGALEEATAVAIPDALLGVGEGVIGV